MKYTAIESEKENESKPLRQHDSQQQSASNSQPGSVASLHRMVGNQAVQRLHESGDLQAKLAVSQPVDRDEREAGRVADKVLGMSGPEPRANSVEKISHQSAGREPQAVRRETERLIETLQGGGRLLPPSARSFFEPRFGRDFGDVRVHTNSKADEAARSINAKAFTIDTDIVFRAGRYDPTSDRGRKLLAHELTHVVQQDGTAINAGGPTDDASTRLGRNSSLSQIIASSTGTVIQRQADVGVEETTTSREQGDVGVPAGRSGQGRKPSLRQRLTATVDRKKDFRREVHRLRAEIDKQDRRISRATARMKRADELLANYGEYSGRRRNQALGTAFPTPGPLTTKFLKWSTEEMGAAIKSESTSPQIAGWVAAITSPLWVFGGTQVTLGLDGYYSWYKRLSDFVVKQPGELTSSEADRVRRLQENGPQIVRDLKRQRDLLEENLKRAKRRWSELKEREERLRNRVRSSR
jgi:hypothetical protein